MVTQSRRLDRLRIWETWRSRRLLDANPDFPTLGDILRVAQSFLGEAPASVLSNGIAKFINSPTRTSNMRIAQGRKLFSYG